MSDDEIAFYKLWVDPFYLKLMNGNFIALLSQDEQRGFVKQVQDTIASLDDKILRRMLSDENWRHRLTAGWFIGFGKMDTFTDAIGQSLLQYPYYAGMYCFALARIGSGEAVEHLRHYLDKHLVPEKARNQQAETLTVNYGLAALEWVSNEDSRLYYPDRYEEFVSANRDYYPAEWIDTAPDLFNSKWDINQVRSRFKQWMDYAEKHFD